MEFFLSLTQTWELAGFPLKTALCYEVMSFVSKPLFIYLEVVEVVALPACTYFSAFVLCLPFPRSNLVSHFSRYIYVMMRNAGGGLHYFSFIFPHRLVSLLNNSRTGFIDNQFDGGFPFQLARFVCVMTTAVNIVLRPRPQSVSCIPELHPPATVCDNDDDVGHCPDDQRM